MDLAPELSSFGYRVTRGRNETAEEAEARFLENRDGDTRQARRR